MKFPSPRVGELKIEDVIDIRIMRTFDESGFSDHAYVAQGKKF